MPLAPLFGAALLLVGAGAVLLPFAFAGRPEPRLLGGNVPVNAGALDLRDLSAHNSPSLVRSPVDPKRVAIANRIDTPRFSCAVHLSNDGGARFTQLPIPVPAGEEPKCYAPDVAFGADGTLYLSFVTLKGNGNVPNAAWVATLRRGRRGLSLPVPALGPLAFQVRLVADPVVPGRLYLSWLQGSAVSLFRFAGPGNPIRLMRSQNGGASWSAPARVSSPARGRVVAPSAAVGPGGLLYVLYLDLGADRLDYEGAHQGRGGPPYQGPFKLVLARSEDRGATWRESVVEERLVPTERFVVFIPPFPSLAVDRRRGRVYVGFEDARSGDADVRVWSQAEGSGGWRGPTRVNDTPRRDRSSQYRPRLAVAPNGRLDVVYYDRRADPKNIRNEVSLQSSFDQGQTFTRRLRLSDRPFDSGVGFGSERGMADLGSRLALLSDDQRAFAVWSDSRAGTRASGKQDLTRAVVGFAGPGLSGLARGALRWGGGALALAGVVVLGLSLVGSDRRRAMLWRVRAAG